MLGFVYLYTSVNPRVYYEIYKCTQSWDELVTPYFSWTMNGNSVLFNVIVFYQIYVKFNCAQRSTSTFFVNYFYASCTFTIFFTMYLLNSTKMYVSTALLNNDTNSVALYLVFMLPYMLTQSIIKQDSRRPKLFPSASWRTNTSLNHSLYRLIRM